MAIELASLIPRPEQLRRRTGRHEPEKPSPEAVGKMARYLQECGYTPVNREVYETVLAYGAAELEGKNRRGLFLFGDSSIGKSFGVECLATLFRWPVVSAKQFETAFLDPAVTPTQWTDLLEGRFSLGDPHTIVIDDMGTESYPVMKFGTPYNLMCDILDHRYYQSFLRHGVRTVVTCNLNDAAIRQRYGFRIDERLNEIMQFAAVKGRGLR
ncbi:MAG: hypothetical protein HPZ91_19195 [Lentisphaeria bacterium]|nr:hypothetical protein [Lentisphaeria bacterium]